MSLRGKLKRFLADNKLSLEGTGLLAVSGGADSVALCHLMKEAGYAYAIAHCNFGLRGEESEGDEAFVSELAGRLEVPFHTTRFNTDIPGQSIQMAARELRYRWLEEVRSENGYSYIATAHHRDDNTETVLLNLAKGSYLRGLGGIAPKQGHIIRPLLWADKREILKYLHRSDLPHREDSSNQNPAIISTHPKRLRHSPACHPGDFIP